MERQLEVQAGVPVQAVVDGDDQVISGTLPAGRYASEQPDLSKWETELAFRLAD